MIPDGAVPAGQGAGYRTGQGAEEGDGAAADLRAGVRVLRAEAAGLLALAGSLRLASFGRAVQLMAEMGGQGRVIVSGMGKSGHVGAKIAATLASTGTPAQFVHPAEASHGDLGMITERDLVLALSNSGETPELADLIAYTKRFAIPLLAVTSHADSTLGRAATVLLALPKLPEAGALGLAPTVSTTMTLALGDALAVALLERRGFTAERFRDFHPGGKLGRRLLTLAEVMHTALPLVEPETPMGQAMLVMSEHRFGCAGVVDGAGRLVGMLTDGDLRRAMAPDLLVRRASQVMKPGPVTARPDQFAAEALQMMNQRQITQLFVVDAAQHPVGLVHLHDLLRLGVA